MYGKTTLCAVVAMLAIASSVEAQGTRRVYPQGGVATANARGRGNVRTPVGAMKAREGVAKAALAAGPAEYEGRSTRVTGEGPDLGLPGTQPGQLPSFDGLPGSDVGGFTPGQGGWGQGMSHPRNVENLNLQPKPGGIQGTPENDWFFGMRDSSGKPMFRNYNPGAYMDGGANVNGPKTHPEIEGCKAECELLGGYPEDSEITQNGDVIVECRDVVGKVGETRWIVRDADGKRIFSEFEPIVVDLSNGGSNQRPAGDGVTGGGAVDPAGRPVRGALTLDQVKLAWEIAAEQAKREKTDPRIGLLGNPIGYLGAASVAGTAGSGRGNASVAAASPGRGGLVGSTVARGSGGALPIDPDPDAAPRVVDPSKLQRTNPAKSRLLPPVPPLQ